MKKTRILLVDDHPLLRAGISKLINEQKDLEVCGEVDTAKKTIDTIKATKPNIVVLDISIKGDSGIEVLKDIKVHAPDVKVLILSMHDETTYAPRTLRAGASGYITKEQAPESVINAIRAIQKGETWLSDRMKSKMLTYFARGASAPSTSPVDVLSDRELEVLTLLGRGIGTRQIAQQMGLSVKTIESHRAHIKEKLQLESAPQLLRFAIEWVDSEGAGGETTKE